MPERRSKRRKLAVSVLDLCKRSPTQPAGDALRDVVALAQTADSLGYSRFWIAEHHTDDAAQSSPEVLLPLIAASTRSIRVGAGGILLQYYSAVKVLEIFLALEALFPGRIDLGLCRGPGLTSQDLARALVDGHDAELERDTFEKKARELAAMARQSRKQLAPDSVSGRPLGVRPPPIWVLGSGEGSARLAADLGSCYAYSLFFGGGLAIGPPLVAAYREGLEKKGHAAIAVSVICASTDARAATLDAELVAQGCRPSNVVGSADSCARAIASFAALFDVDEVIVATFIADRRARIGLYERLAEALRLR